MLKTAFFLFTFLFSTLTGFGQDLQLYKDILRTADTLISTGKISELDKSVYETAKRLDKLHPSSYFTQVGELLKTKNYNEASFLFFVGVMRYKYYNTVNPNYEKSEDGALLGSMVYVMGEPVDLWLKSSLDNYLFVMDASLSYYEKNDSEFCSKKKDKKKYNEQPKAFKELANELKSKKAAYAKEWDDNRIRIEGAIDQGIKAQEENNEPKGNKN